MTGRHPGRAVAIAACLSAVLCSSAGAQTTLKGVALAIGQSDYETLSDLANTQRDAKGIEDLLDRLGFETDAATDRDARQLRRDLEGFVEDAQEADVAVLYYAGHAVEIGGENFLLPVDVDAATPETLAEGLVPVGRTLEALRQKAKLVIILLDACRDNPLPPGTSVRLQPGGEAEAVAIVGAGTRGIRLLSRQLDAASGTLGMVIGFAAEPGKVALDGDAGGNSPYAAALLRHLSAMAGEEFGTVMRMVAEEVYLKTGGRQRPWVNESLSRLLYFGEPAPDPTGDEGDMLAERRQLLLTVAALPNPERRRVEQAAEGVGVPMDRLYGLLRALGADAPANPDELDALLRTEAARMASLVAEREMVVSPDPEIIRLSAMADRAEGEGLLETARRLRDRAKTRFRNIEPTLEEQQDALDARFIEGAEVFSRSAETRALAFDYGGAAADYGEAYARVEGRDIGLAWKYKLREANSLYDRGRTHTDNDALRRAVASAKQANALAETALRNITTMPPEMAAGDVDDMARVTESFRIVSGFLAQQQRDQIARAQHDLGNMLQDLGERLGDDTFMHEAEAAYATALQVWNRQDNPVEWLRTSSAIATLRTTLGQRQAGMAGLDAAVSTFERLLAELPEGLPDGDVGALLVNHGRALLLSGTRADDRGRLLAAADTYEAAVARLPRATAPLDWAAAQNNRGSVLLALAERSDDDPDLLAQARTAFELSLEERTRDRVPYDWAQARHNLGVALYRAGWKARDPVRLRESLAVLGDTLQEWTREQTPRDWALATSSLADVLARLGELENDPARQREAVAAWRDTLSVWTAQAAPSEWARTQANLGRTLIALAQGNEERQDLVEAIDAYEALVTEWTYEKAAYSWAQAQRTMGGAWQTLWTRGAPIESLENSIAAYRASTRVFTLDTDVQRWSDAEDKIGAMQVVLGLNRKSPEQVAEGRARFVAVRDALRAAGHDQFEAHFHERLTLADQALAALQPEPPGPPANR